MDSLLFIITTTITATSSIVTLSIIFVTLTAIYLYFRKKYSYWHSLGIGGPTPYFPVGNLHSYLRYGQWHVDRQMWNGKFGKIFGIYVFTKPILYVTHHVLIRKILLKDFAQFRARSTPRTNIDHHRIWRHNMMNAEPDRWKVLRSITAPIFSSAKLRSMYGRMDDAVHKLTRHLTATTETGAGVNDAKSINAKQIMIGFTVDMIASTMFAIETTNANETLASKTGGRNKDGDGESSALIRNSVHFLEFNPLRILSFTILPLWFNKAIGNSLGISDAKFDYFHHLCDCILQQKRNSGKTKFATKNVDFVQLLMQASIDDDADANVDVDKKRTLTDEEIIAQCILFFVGGFETTATSLANCLYHLAANPVVQERLYEEIVQTLDKSKSATINENQDQIIEQEIATITTTGGLPYLEAIIKETIRINPPIPQISRMVTNDGGYTLKLDGSDEDNNEENPSGTTTTNSSQLSIHLPPDQVVSIPVISVHHCEEYYPNPSRFDPDRFMPANRHRLKPYAYLPFGDGPRNCIGERFALQVMKICITRLVHQFCFVNLNDDVNELQWSKIGFLNASNVPVKVLKRQRP